MNARQSQSEFSIFLMIGSTYWFTIASSEYFIVCSQSSAGSLAPCFVSWGLLFNSARTVQPILRTGPVNSSRLRERFINSRRRAYFDVILYLYLLSVLLTAYTHVFRYSNFRFYRRVSGILLLGFYNWGSTLVASIIT